MKKIHLSIALIFLILAPYVLKAQFPNIPIGSWRDHLSYYQTKKLTLVEDRILVSAGSAMFFFDREDNSVERFSKVDGLSDAGITQLSYDKASKSIVVVYENSNIDIIQNNKVYNIPDIKIRSIEGSKMINNITFFDNKAYLSCGFGIVVLDLKRKEIFETFYIGENSSKINVNNVVIYNDSIYAATVEGLLYAPYNSPFLATSETWVKYENFNNPSDKEILYLFEFNKKLLVGIENEFSNISLFEMVNNNFDTVFSNQFAYWIKPSNNHLIVKSWGTAPDIIVYDTLYNMERIIDSSWFPIINDWDGVTKFVPEVGDAMIINDEMFLSHEREGGLLQLKNYKENIFVKSIYPNGPLSNDVFSITATNDIIYVAPGGKTIQHAPRGIPANIYHFNRYYWDCLSNFREFGDTLRDIVQVSVDPRNPKHIMAASYWNGVIEVMDNKIIKVWDKDNTNNVLSNDSYGYRIIATQYDMSGNLLVANSLSSTALCYLNYRNVWGNFNTYNMIGEDETLGLLIDQLSGNFYKFIWTSNNKILAINNNGDQVIIDPNNGAKDQSNKVNCMVQDKEGEIWIGTDKGIKVIYSLDDIYKTQENGISVITCNNIIYQEEGIAQYLLNFDNINCILVDGGNRKWVGTERNGIFVFSPNGDKQLFHFNAENSPLYSNRVLTMAQDPKTGEIFIGTDRGVISYKAESTAPKEEAGSLYVYPNPVRPDYNGTIAIQGFVYDSDVKITDLAGNIVAHTKSVGGQAIWNGKNFKGERVSSGVYLIFGSANEGQEKAVGKVLFVR